MKSKIEVEVVNLKKLLPACRRCRIRSNEMLADKYQPMICDKCREVIVLEYPHMVPLVPVPLERARECLWEHERECECWQEGLKFPLDSEMDLR
jgi:hypothetical protein